MTISPVLLALCGLLLSALGAIPTSWSTVYRTTATGILDTATEGGCVVECSMDTDAAEALAHHLIARSWLT